jgi:hypothetical protein
MIMRLLTGDHNLVAELQNAVRVLADFDRGTHAAAARGLFRFTDGMEARRGRQIPARLADEVFRDARELLIGMLGN